GGALGDQIRQHPLAERLEAPRVAEEARLVGGHRLHHLAVEAVPSLRAQPGDQLLERRAALLARDRNETRLGEVLLALVENDARTLAHQPPHEIEVAREEAHRIRPSATPGTVRPAHARCTIAPGIAGSASTSSAIPARKTAPGMPQTTLVASS